MPLGIIPFPFGKCRICQDKATGLHYGVATCEGCKGFFKRSTLRGSKYKCYFGGGCEITPKNRNRCKSCRFKRCQDVGMALDAVRMGRIPKVEKEKVLEVFHQCGSDYNKLELSAEKAIDGSYDFKMNPAENILDDESLPKQSISTSSSGTRLPDSDENANIFEELDTSKQTFMNTATELDLKNPQYSSPHRNLITSDKVNGTVSRVPLKTQECDNKPSVKDGSSFQAFDKSRFSGSVHTYRNEMIDRSKSVYSSCSVSNVQQSNLYPVRQVSETITSPSTYNQDYEKMLLDRNDRRLFVHEQERINREGFVNENYQGPSPHEFALNLIKDTNNKEKLKNSGTQFSRIQERTSLVQPLQIPQKASIYMSDPGCSKTTDICHTSNPKCSDITYRKYVTGQETRPHRQSEYPYMSEFGSPDKPLDMNQTQILSFPSDSHSVQDKFGSYERAQDQSSHQSNQGSFSLNLGTCEIDQKRQQDLDIGFMKYDEKINTIVAELEHETQIYIQNEHFEPPENHPSPMEGTFDSDISSKGTGSISSRSSSWSKFNQSVLKIFSEVISEPVARERLTDRLRQILGTKDNAYVDSVINVVRNELQNILSQLGSSTQIQQKPGNPDRNANEKTDNDEMIESKKRTLKRFLDDIKDFSGNMRYPDEQKSPSYTENPDMISNEVLDYTRQNVALSGSSGYHSGKHEEIEQWLVSLNLAMKILYRLKPEHRDKIKLFRMGKINLRVMTDTDEDVAFVYDRIISSIPLLNERVLGFCDQVPNFSSLNKDDKGKLMKRAYYDIWMLTYSEYFRGRKSEMILSTGEIYSVEAMRKILNDRIVDTMLDFAEEFNSLHLSDLEISILCAVRLTLADDVEIEDRQAVSQIHADMMNVFRYEMERNHPYDHVQLLNKILKLLPLLEEINRIQKTVIANFPMKFKKQ